MSVAFRPVNLSHHDGPQQGSNSPSTMAALAPQPPVAPPVDGPKMHDDAATPTRANFSDALASQKPLPSTPFLPQAVQQLTELADSKLPRRDNSQHSRKSRDSEDVDMDDSDGEGIADEGNASDDESVNADGTKSNKKKKSQRFYCNEYPPCTLSFTRSEHLARHIRKHTGERPFQCHCGRRFSRLDNLRQHAQTVHVNEEIPLDSLASTGSRFQRQIRTERVRQPGPRARANTNGSVPGPVRGHSKSYSTSNITNIGPMGPGYAREDARRRPAPLVMSTDPRARHSWVSQRESDSSYPHRPSSPSDFSTPTSATFSTAPGSPRYSILGTPTTTHSRSHSMYASGSRTPGRRLSVPSPGNPFSHGPHGPAQRHPFGPPGLEVPDSGSHSPAPSSLLASPTTSTSGWTARRDSLSSTTDEGWRRRTWHPDTRANFAAPINSLNSMLHSAQYQPTPDAPLAVRPAKPETNVRLPGIESFDPLLQVRPRSPPRRAPSPMMIDSGRQNPPVMHHGSEHGPEPRRSTQQWDMALHRGLTRLDLGSNTTPPRDSAHEWANQVHQAFEASTEQIRSSAPSVRFDNEPTPSFSHGNEVTTRTHHHTVSAPVPPRQTPREAKRHGWYQSPPPAMTGSSSLAGPPVESRAAYVDRMAHPNMSSFQGFPAREQQPAIHQQPPPQPPNNEQSSSRGLDLLVAVATSDHTTTAY